MGSMIRRKEEKDELEQEFFQNDWETQEESGGRGDWD